MVGERAPPVARTDEGGGHVGDPEPPCPPHESLGLAGVARPDLDELLHPGHSAPPPTFERVFDGSTERGRAGRPGGIRLAVRTSTARMPRHAATAGRSRRAWRRQARSSSVRAPKTISSQLGIDARPFLGLASELAGPVAVLPPQSARAAVPGFSSGGFSPRGRGCGRLGDRRGQRERQLRLLGLGDDRGLAFAAATAQRLEQVGRLAERRRRLVGALDRGPRGGGARRGRRACARRGAARGAAPCRSRRGRSRRT